MTTLDQLAYTPANFARAVDLSYEFIRQEMRDGNLVPSYAKSKKLISRDEGLRWLKSLPTERVA